MTLRTPSGAVRDDVTVPQGAAWARTWSITDSVGNPLTVTGWSVRAQIRYSHNDALFFEWNTTPGVGIGTAVASGTTVSIQLVGTDSATWAFAQAAYDVVLTDPMGEPTRIVEGMFTLDPSITHS